MFISVSLSVEKRKLLKFQYGTDFMNVTEIIVLSLIFFRGVSLEFKVYTVQYYCKAHLANLRIWLNALHVWSTWSTAQHLTNCATLDKLRNTWSNALRI